MGITRVQGNARATTNTNVATVTLASTPITGNVLIAVIGARWSGGTPSVSSVVQTNVTWAKQVSKSEAPAGQDIEIWFGIVGVNPSNTITVTFNTSMNRGAAANVCEYSGILTTGFLDKTATAQGGPSNLSDTGTTATTTQASELWIGGIIVANGALQTNPTNGFTLMDGVVYIAANTAYLEKIVSNIGTANSGTTLQQWYYDGCIATFKAKPDDDGLHNLLMDEEYL